MRAGKVVRIRVNPTDCLSVLDLCEKVGIPTSGMSFSQCISVALSSLLETARVQKVLPQPDTFQFLNRMHPFMDTSHHRKKLEVARTISEMGATFRAPVMQASVEMPQVELTSAQASAAERLTILLQKKDSDAEWTAHDEEEFKQCYHLVYPEG